MNRTISLRELVLLGILIVLAAYYFVVQGPVAKETEELTQRRSELNSQIDSTSIEVEAMNRMQAELDGIYEAAGGNPQSLANYSNNRVLLQELNIIMNMADEFDVSFGDLSFSDNIMRRVIAINFTTQSQEAAEFIVDSIESSTNTYLVTGFNTSRNNNGVWSSNMTLVNYEYVTDEQAKELGLVDENAAADAEASDTGSAS